MSSLLKIMVIIVYSLTSVFLLWWYSLIFYHKEIKYPYIKTETNYKKYHQKPKNNCIWYLVTSTLAILLNMISYLFFGFTVDFFLSSLTMMIYIFIIFFDYKYYIIPDYLNLMLGAVSLASLIIPFILYHFFNIEISYNYETFNNKILGFTIGIILLIGFEIINNKRKEAPIIGGGDLKLFVVTGLFLGAKLFLLGLFLGSFIACIIEVPRLSKKESKLIPFGPYLTYGFIISILFGSNIIEGYLKFVGM